MKRFLTYDTNWVLFVLKDKSHNSGEDDHSKADSKGKSPSETKFVIYSISNNRKLYLLKTAEYMGFLKFIYVSEAKS